MAVQDLLWTVLGRTGGTGKILFVDFDASWQGLPNDTQDAMSNHPQAVLHQEAALGTWPMYGMYGILLQHPCTLEGYHLLDVARHKIGTVRKGLSRRC